MRINKQLLSNQTRSLVRQVGDYLKPQPGKTRPIDVIRELPKAIYQTQGGPQLESSAKTLGEAAFATFPSKEYRALEDRGEIDTKKQEEIIPTVKKSLGKIVKELSFGIGGPLGLASMASYLGDYKVISPTKQQPAYYEKQPTPVEKSYNPMLGEVLPKKIIKPSVAKHLLSDAAGQVDYALSGNLTSGKLTSAVAKEISSVNPNNITGKEHLASIIKEILTKNKLISNKAVMQGVKNTLSNFQMFRNNGINPFVYLIY